MENGVRKREWVKTAAIILLAVLLVLTFFAENGHYTLLRILLSSGQVVPYGTATLGKAVASGVAEVFFSCMVLSTNIGRTWLKMLEASGSKI